MNAAKVEDIFITSVLAAVVLFVIGAIYVTTHPRVCLRVRPVTQYEESVRWNGNISPVTRLVCEEWKK